MVMVLPLTHLICIEEHPPAAHSMVAHLVSMGMEEPPTVALPMMAHLVSMEEHPTVVHLIQAVPLLMEASIIMSFM